MRIDDSPMTLDDFESALADAKLGMMVSDTGATDDVTAALEAVAADAPNPSHDLVTAARAAFLRS